MSEQKKQQNIQQLDRKQMKTLFQGLNFQDDLKAGQKSALPYDASDRLDQRQRAFVQHWSAVIERSDKGLAKLFLQHAPEALGQMGFEGTEAWLLHALEQFDQRGIGWAQQILRSVDRVATVWNSRCATLSLNETLPLLRHLILGLGGRELRLVAGGQCYTDTETLYLPAELSLSDDQAENFRLYKATTVHHWAQTWYGTWRADILEHLLRLLQNHSTDEARRLLDGFCVFERLRLDACIARDLPGIWRDMLVLRNRFGATVADKAEIWITASHHLARPQASASDSLNWLLQLADDVMIPPPDCYHGVFRPEKVHEVLSKRLIRERERLQIMVGKLRDDLAIEETQPATADNQPMRTRKPTEGFSLSQQPPRQGSGLNVRLYLDKQPVPIPDDIEQLLGSVLQDLGAIPEEYFRPGGQKPYDADHTGATAGSDRAPEEYLTDNVLRYPEWDYMRQRFRPDYCMLREHDVTSGDGAILVNGIVVDLDIKIVSGMLNRVDRTK